MGKIFSPGKLLLTSEYTVLDGALALAVPTQQGQEFFFEEIADAKSLVVWEAYHLNKLWLRAKINYENWTVLETNIPQSAEFVVKVLKNVQRLSQSKFQDNSSYHLKTNLQFPANFGLGSSSTLMNNLAEWSAIDAFLLNDDSLGGSGYDIAIAKEKAALLFQIKEKKREWQRIDFNPEFKNELIFIHLNQKQDSREGIKMYKSVEKSAEIIQQFTDFTKEIIQTKTIEKFSEIMALHEKTLSRIIKMETVKDQIFPDCPTFVKSLGAWGGDFVMSSKFENHVEYFTAKGFPTIFEWKEMIL
ncbi:MAG: GYDIA family GHMP kinase [Cruoricaptor ignavus]|nr:GYDIA family GHMP kinase [Cruoricaptor ignavus]